MEQNMYLELLSALESNSVAWYEPVDVSKLPIPILSLPTELIQNVSKYLDVEFQICLSLSCKQIQNAIGTKCWTEESLRRGVHGIYATGDQSRRMAFLSYLARDLPGWEYCRECRVLHPPLKSPAEWRPNGALKPCLAQHGMIDYHPRSGEGGYVILLEHIRCAFAQANGFTGEPVPMMSTAYSIGNLPAGLASYDVQFSAQKIRGNLILKASHAFIGTDNFQITDILDLPLCICPHLTTRTTGTQFSEHSRWNCTNRTLSKTHYTSPLLTFVVSEPFTKVKSPVQLMRLLGRSGKFRDPTYTEQNQISAQRHEDDFWWCRSCPTKFRVKKVQENALIVNVWQNVGTTANGPRWSALVRTADAGRTRNWEFDGISRNFGDFECE